jgi:hypothetical protein
VEALWIYAHGCKKNTFTSNSVVDRRTVYHELRHRNGEDCRVSKISETTLVGSSKPSWLAGHAHIGMPRLYRRRVSSQYLTLTPRILCCHWLGIALLLLISDI